MGNYSTAISGTSGIVSRYRMNQLAGATSLLDDVGANNLTASNVTFGQLGLICDGDTDTAALLNAGAGGLAYSAQSASAVAASSAVFSFERTQAWSVEFIVNSATGITPGDGTVVSKVSGVSPFPGWEVAMVHNTYQIRVWLISNFGSANYIEITSSLACPPNTNYHVAVTYDGSSTAAGVKIYVNGMVDPAPTINKDALSASIISAVPFNIGARQASAWYGGILDEVAIFNRALSGTEVASHFTLYSTVAGDIVDPAQPPTIIFDDDNCTDCDGMMNLAYLNYLADNGVCNVGGSIISSSNVYAAPCLYAVNKLYDRQSVIVGSLQGSTPTVNGGSSWTQSVAASFAPGMTRAAFSEATAAYRQMLVNAPDGRAIICSGGFWEPLQNLMNSSADAISPLTGMQLILQKVYWLVVTAAMFPTDGGTPQFNIQTESTIAADVVSRWPTDQVWVAINDGNSIISGPPTGTNTPVNDAFNLHGTATRPSWGNLAVRVAAQGKKGEFITGGLRGTLTINTSTNSATWSRTPGRVTWLIKTKQDSYYAGLFNTALAAAPASFRLHQLTFCDPSKAAAGLSTVYCTLEKGTKIVDANGVLQDFSLANLQLAYIPMMDLMLAARYSAPVPANTPVGNYRLVVRLRAGSQPAGNDSVLLDRSYGYNGSVEVPGYQSLVRRGRHVVTE